MTVEERRAIREALSPLDGSKCEFDVKGMNLLCPRCLDTWEELVQMDLALHKKGHLFYVCPQCSIRVTMAFVMMDLFRDVQYTVEGPVRR